MNSIPPQSNQEYLAWIILNICLCNDVIPIYEDELKIKNKKRKPKKKNKKSRNNIHVIESTLDSRQSIPHSFI